MEAFSDLARKIQGIGSGSPLLTPIQVCQRPDGKMILIDGNHRAAVALHLGLPIPAARVAARAYLTKIASVPDEFYGAGRLGRPYQSLYLGRREILTGRRRDIRERLSMVSHSDITDATVADLGCNIGASCFLAAQEGAREVIGFDVSPRLVSAAIALNAYFASPCRFYVHDLNCGAPEDARPADTVFCFSIARHVERRDGLREALLRMTRKVLYFEGHPNTSLSDYGDLLPGDEFPKVELIGLLPEAVDRPRRNRPLWRCERRAET
jgi:SAM-dependent methyltransferase